MGTIRTMYDFGSSYCDLQRIMKQLNDIREVSEYYEEMCPNVL